MRVQYFGNQTSALCLLWFWLCLSLFDVIISVCYLSDTRLIAIVCSCWSWYNIKYCQRLTSMWTTLTSTYPTWVQIHIHYYLNVKYERRLIKRQKSNNAVYVAPWASSCVHDINTGWSEMRSVTGVSGWDIVACCLLWRCNMRRCHVNDQQFPRAECQIGNDYNHHK